VDVVPGAPVRVSYRNEARIGAPTLTVSGSYLERTEDRLRFETGSGEPREIPLDRLVRLQTRTGGSRAAAAGKGALWGGVGGALLGMGLAVAFCSDDFCETDAQALAGVALVFGGAGAGAGALLGASFLGEEWREVPVPASDR
jgi:hypothetical protein